MHGEEDVTANYAITAEAGKLTINPKAVTVTAKSEAFTYDGTAHSNAGYDVVGLVGSDAISAVVTGSITFPSESPVTNKLTSYEFTTGTPGNYSVTTADGELTMTTASVAITITAASDSWTYDGTAHSNTTVTVTSGELLTGDELVAEATGSVTNVADTADNNNPVKAGYKIMHGEEDVTANYAITAEAGTLTINPKTVTLVSGSKTREYNGSALTNAEVEDKNANGLTTETGWVGNEGATYEFTGTITEAGSVKNAFTYTLKEGTIASNYTINKTEGDLIVTAVTAKVTVTITEKSGSEKYDGTEKTVTGYVVTSISNALYTEANFTFSGNATVKGTDAGSYEMKLTAGDFTNISTNFTNVEFVIVDGTLEIGKRTVTLTSATDEKVYDGTALTNDEVTVGGDGFATGEGATYDVTGTITDAGNTKNTFTYTLNTNTKADNYTITTTEGTLTVTPVTDKVTVTITENSGSEKYDGTEKTVTGYTVTSISNTLYKATDFTFSGDATVKGTDAGSYPMELKAADFANVSKNFSNVEFVIVDGKLEISKRNVTLTSSDDEKVYDGTALTNDTVTVGGDGFADGEGAAYDVTGTITDVGDVANAFTYTLNAGTNAANYTITTAEGKLTVTPVTDKVTVTITENSDSEKYDGSEKTVTGYTVDIDNELYTEADFEFSGDATVKGTDAGTYEMELVAGDFTNVSKNFTNVEFVIVDGTLEIAKREVTLTSASDRKVYDGTALTNDEVTVSGDGFAEGEGATYEVTGTQTLAGESENTFTYTLDEATKADNYEITVVPGTLKVTDGTEDEDEEDVPDELVVTKTSDRGEAYKVGETVEWTITVTNIYDEEKTLTVTEAEGMNIIGEVPATLAAGETVEITVQHVVTEADAAEGTVRNEVTVKTGDLEKKGEDTVDVTSRYRLTVNYWIGTTPAADTFTNVYNSGDTYAVTSPAILGYTPDQDRVSGTITADTTIDVYYTVNSYDMTVNYVYTDGTEASTPYTILVEYNTPFDVPVPELPGYTAVIPTIDPTMPAHAVIYTVIYVANTPQPAPTTEDETDPVIPRDHVPYTILEDYDTALGIPNLSMTTGEVYE